jgi:hypothetical protein
MKCCHTNNRTNFLLCQGEITEIQALFRTCRVSREEDSIDWVEIRVWSRNEVSGRSNKKSVSCALTDPSYPHELFFNQALPVRITWSASGCLSFPKNQPRIPPANAPMILQVIYDGSEMALTLDAMKYPARMPTTNPFTGEGQLNFMQIKTN